MSARAWGGRPAGAPPRVIGHRGAAGAATENTIEAFEEAARQGADGVEFDVRPCASGELVVLHDVDLARVTGGVDGRAAAALDARALASVRLAGGERVPRLGDALAWARGRGLLVNVELKPDVPSRPSAVAALARELARSGVDESLLVSSFDALMLLGLRALAPRAATGLLFPARGRRYGAWRLGPWLGARALHPERSLVTAERVGAARRRGRSVNVWTVNDAAEARRLGALGVDAIITDRPGLVRAALRGAGEGALLSRFGGRG